MKSDPHVQLMLRFQRGDENAFKQLFDVYKVQLLNFIYRYCQDRRVAEELAQEVFLRVYKNAASYRPDAKFSTWVYRIATNVCLNEIRSSRYRCEVGLGSKDSGDDHREYELADRSPEKRADEQILAEERRRSVRKAIGLLPEKQRIALLSREYDHLSYKDIAERLECSEGAVKSIIHRAKIALKNHLKKEIRA